MAGQARQTVRHEALERRLFNHMLKELRLHCTLGVLEIGIRNMGTCNPACEKTAEVFSFFF